MDKKPVSKTQQEHVAKYKKKNYKRFSIEARIEEAAAITDAAAKAGESINGYVLGAVRRRMESGD